MSRLIDRIRMNGCTPVKLSLIAGGFDANVAANVLNEEAAKQNKTLSHSVLNSRIAQAASNYYRNEPTSAESLNPEELTDVPAFAADDVAIYCNTLPLGTRMEDVVSSMAPPFDKFFIEFQNIPNQRTEKDFDRLYSWGTLVTAISDTSYLTPHPGDDGKPRWILQFRTVFEREKGKPFGPVAHHVAGLAEDGTWFRHADGMPFWGGGLVDMKGGFNDDGPPPVVIKEMGDHVAQLLFPALLALSFLHCKNIEIKTIEPSDKLSKKHLKKYGSPLSRYHVLEISPIKRIIEQVRHGLETGLRKALHICRGHFKTFTSDAPLFGRHTGTYWWPYQVRGSKSAGNSLKDYRVIAPSEIGKVYQDVNEGPVEAVQSQTVSNPDLRARSLAAHNRIQNLIAQVVRELGFIPRSPSLNEPEFDLAWKVRDTLYVCEVKSTTTANEEKQLRMAIGQVIRYRQKLNSLGHEPVMAVIAIENSPFDPSWPVLCDYENILLLWPDNAKAQLRNTLANNISTS